ncbi:hypothetical protein ABER61_09140 [Brevibacillus formosus]|uniref:PepSY domain-containing protein n=1 Tax=Brevibacillus formosus TaxID=54913 RepID=A0A837KKV4_9BACL|nr:hypothetical protein [Brevibacillus formosus]KLH97813.1 hypothetical protein AA984_18280 [Brevibacillus formosus]MED1957379.1 hypothetical protein [Brevibacillus formosus]PSJ98772.1 hypothetical protein C7R91_05105 [Brevibacillus formosus]GED57489.1 hypothetical protein BFO01nite_16210 [Brevibacillus formosus]
MKKSKTKKTAAWLNLSVMSVLTMTAMFSPVAASAAPNDTKNNVAAEATEEEFDLLKLTDQQAAPFLAKAKEAFQAKNVSLPESGYKARNYGSKKDNTLTVVWRSETNMKDKAYVAEFEDIDAVKGTGTLKTVKVINRPGSFEEELTEKHAAPFIEQAKEALKAKNITLPASGYKMLSSSRTYDDVLESVQITWRPDAGQKEGKYYSVQFADVDLEKGTGIIDDVYVENYDELIALEEEDEKDKQEDREQEKDLLKLTDQQAAPFLAKAKEALQAEKIELPKNGYKVTHFGSKKDKTLQVLWSAEEQSKGYVVHFVDVDVEKGTATVKNAKVINELGVVMGDLPQEQAAPFIEKAKEAMKAKNFTPSESAYEISATGVTVDDVLQYIDVYWYPNGNPSAKYKVHFTGVNLEKGTGTVEDVVEYKR